jgi:hypothetical protein
MNICRNDIVIDNRIFVFVYSLPSLVMGVE